MSAPPPAAQGPVLRPIEARDDPALARVIRAVMQEFGAVGPGFSIVDPEVDGMSRAYSAPRSAYFVAERAHELLGGAGVAPLAGAEPAVCELRKMYLVPHARGLGLGRALLEAALAAARAHGFRRCYLETLRGMDRARDLYLASGFEPLPGPLGCTGHFGCDAWYARAL
jgi:putative acetyltransferase